MVGSSVNLLGGLDRMRLLSIVLLACAMLPLGTQPKEAKAAQSDLCAALASHQARPDVAFRPGVDVNGAPVAPADIGRSAVELPEVMEFEITVDLAGARRPEARRPGPRQSSPVHGEGFVGVVTLLPDGVVLFNGRPLEMPEEIALRQFCATPEAGR